MEIIGYDPRTGTTLPPIPATTVEEADLMVDAAITAAAGWMALPRTERGAHLRAIAAALEAAGDEIVDAADAETALGRTRLESELRRTTGQLRMFAADIEAGHYLGALITEADPSTGTPDLRRMRVPRGPVAVFAASNFPLAFSVSGGDTASALAAGCPVIVKAHENHPRTSDLVGSILTQALPLGVFALCHGREAGTALVAHAGITAVGFTGSLQGGSALSAACSARPTPIPFFGELGSLNPVVVMPDAAAASGIRVAEGFVASLTLGNGQFCTKPGLIFVPRASRMPELLAEALAQTTSGALLTPRIREGYVDHVGHGTLPLLARGHADPQIPLAVVPELSIVDGIDFEAALPALTEERFGPAAVVVRYDDLSAVARMIEMLPGSLTGSIHAEQPSTEVGAIADLLRTRVGRLIYNGWPTGVAVALAQHHGGPFPATTDGASTSVGATAIDRWTVPKVYQSWPDELLPPELQRADPLTTPRRVE